jgi:outer membrane lipoprotein-sorting protein
MMDEKKLSQYIDELNAGRRPKEHGDSSREGEKEEQKLLATIRKVRSLREIEYPDEFFEQRLVNSLAGGSGGSVSLKQPVKKARKYTFFYPLAAAAAAILLFVTVYQVLPNQNPSIVYAMEKAMEKIQTYHGIIEVSETNELGETITQSKREVWADQSGNYYIKDLEGTSQGLVTVNNGEQKWQLRPEEKASYLFSAFPDDYRFTFELGNEVDDVTKAQTVNILGTETISGRNTTKLEIIPDGGAAYYLWIDNETDLPLQRVSAMQNAIQIQVSYSSIEFMDTIPQTLLAYELPEGYKEVNTNQEQIVASLEEAEDLIGFIPQLPKQIEEGYTLDRIAVENANSVVKLYYVTEDNLEMVLLTQTKVTKELEPAATAILGTVNDNKAEIITTEPNRSIRWQEKGIEYKLLGTMPIEQLTAFAEKMTESEVVIPEPSGAAKEPQVKVDIDQSVEENEQKSVDAGHSPWKLDPAFVAQVFASLLLSPEGIVGDYPIAYENIDIIENNGTDAIAEIKDDKSIAKYVYLKRLVRQDDTGIWTVVGYDAVK